MGIVKSKKTFEFIAEMTPVPFTRPARANYVLSKDKIFRENLAYIAQIEMNVQNVTIFEGLLSVEVILNRQIGVGSRRYGDVDNHLKNILDALNGVCWKDDSQIISITCKKQYAFSKDTENIKIKIKEELVKI